MIRLAKIEDMPEILRMGESFFNASGYGEITTFNEKDTESLVRKLIREDLLLLKKLRRSHKRLSVNNEKNYTRLYRLKICLILLEEPRY